MSFQVKEISPVALLLDTALGHIGIRLAQVPVYYISIQCIRCIRYEMMISERCDDIDKMKIDNDDDKMI